MNNAACLTETMRTFLFAAPCQVPSLRGFGAFTAGTTSCPAFPTRPHRFTARAVVQTPQAPESTRNQTKQSSRPRRAPELHVRNDSISATPGQRALVASFGGLALAVGVRILMATHGDPLQVLGIAAATAGGWLFADFGTAVYHWAVDNYGNEKTPIFGFQIAAFQGHHLSPWTITNRDFANNLYRLTIPTIPQMAALLFLPLDPVALAGLWSAIFWIVASQELHKQAHMQRPHPIARLLQDIGVIVSRKEHGLHHSAPYEGHYAIVSGIWNPLLDRTRFFRRLEAFIYRRNGVAPIAWSLDPALRRSSLEL